MEINPAGTPYTIQSMFLGFQFKFMLLFVICCFLQLIVFLFSFFFRIRMDLHLQISLLGLVVGSYHYIRVLLDSESGRAVLLNSESPKESVSWRLSPLEIYLLRTLCTAPASQPV